MRRALSLTFAASALSLLLVVALPVLGQDPPVAESGEQSLPVLDVDAPERSLYKIAVPALRGNEALGAQGAEVLENDFRLISLFQVLDARSFLADLNAEGLEVVAAPWASIGAQGVIKGEIRGSGNDLTVEMRLYELARGTTATLTRTYRGNPTQLRGWMHDFANEVLRTLTGEVGAFGTRLTFARRVGAGRKDVYVADFDGHAVGRISAGTGVAMLPNFGPGGVWYSILTENGMFITRQNTNERPLIGGDGLNMGVAPCGGRVVFTSTRDGNAEIYSSEPDGTDVRRLTNHPGIDVSPSCGPGGKIAFVSDRHGGPQVFLMGVGGGEPRRVTYRGNHNQTPAWCPIGSKNLLAFSGRDGGGFDVFTVNIETQEYVRLTQGQGVNKDPAFSPDCRMVAFASSRGGVFLSSPEGLNQNLVIRGAAETVRWSR